MGGWEGGMRLPESLVVGVKKMVCFELLEEVVRRGWYW